MTHAIHLIWMLLALSSPLFAVGENVQSMNGPSDVLTQGKQGPLSLSSLLESKDTKMMERRSHSLQQPLDHDIFWTQIGNTIKGTEEDIYTGAAVDISRHGDIIIVGSPYADNIRHDKNDTGLAIVYRYDYSEDRWSQMGQKLWGRDDDDEIAETVKLAGHGLIAAISSEDHDDDKGHVRVYFYDSDDNKWYKLGRDIDGKYPEDNAGWGMALSDDGFTIAVGSYDNDEGNMNDNFGYDAGQTRVFRFDFEELDWKQIGQTILGKGDENQEGWKVELSRDGNRLLTSGPFYNGDETDGDYAGRVRVYTYNDFSDEWEQLGQSLFGVDDEDEFGIDIAFSDEGNILAIGAGCYYYCEATNGYNHYVEVYKYDEDDETWMQLGNTLVPDYIYNEYYGFGSSVSLNGNGTMLAVGSVGYEYTDLGNGFVTTYSFDEDSGDWERVGQPLVISDGAESSYRLEVMALAKDWPSIIVGSPYEEVRGMDEAGHAKVYDLTGYGVPAGCVDSKLDFEYGVDSQGETKWRNCKFISRKADKRCMSPKIRKVCPATCEIPFPGTCVKNACEQVPTGLKFKVTESKTGTMTCRGVGNNPHRRCEFTGIRDTCRESCPNDMCSVLRDFSD